MDKPKLFVQVGYPSKIIKEGEANSERKDAKKGVNPHSEMGFIKPQKCKWDNRENHRQLTEDPQGDSDAGE